MIKILDIGSGPVPSPFGFITYADRKDYGPNVEYQDMENMTYEDESFDIVHCMNALDHTKNAMAAIDEMIRVCKEGGFVYIDCALIQKTTSGGHHYWDMDEKGTLKNELSSIPLKSLGFEIEFKDNGGERRYNHVVAIFKK